MSGDRSDPDRTGPDRNSVVQVHAPNASGDDAQAGDPGCSHPARTALRQALARRGSTGAPGGARGTAYGPGSPEPRGTGSTGTVTLWTGRYAAARAPRRRNRADQHG